MKKLLQAIYLLVCTAVMLSITAAAYLDPATLTYVIQIVAGALIAGGAVIGIYWKKIKRFFKKKKSKTAPATNVHMQEAAEAAAAAQQSASDD